MTSAATPSDAHEWPTGLSIGTSTDGSDPGAPVGTALVSGELDIETAPHLRAALLGLLDSGCTSLVVDMAAVTFIDSTALGVLVGALRRVRASNGTMTLRIGTPQVLRLLEVTRLDGEFQLEHVSADGATSTIDP